MKKTALLLAAVLALASCYAPVDLLMSQAASLLRSGSVTYQATLGPVDDLGDDDGDREITFLPTKVPSPPGNDFTSGFVVVRSAGSTQMTYAHRISPTQTNTFGHWGADYLNPVPAYEPYIMEPLKNTTPGTASPLGVLAMDPQDASRNAVQVVSAALPGGPVSSGGTANVHDIFVFGMPTVYDADLIGFSVYASNWSLGWDDTYWLVRERGTGQLRELTFHLNEGGFSTKAETKGAAPAFDIPDLAGVVRCHYFFDPDLVRGPTPDKQMSYVSWYDTAAGSWKCLSWKGIGGSTESSVLDKVTHRIDALLTNGMLFSTEDGVGRLYDSEGAQRAEFPLGALRFVGERFIDTVPVAVFSLARKVSEDYQTRWYIDVYTVDTADLVGL